MDLKKKKSQNKNQRISDDSNDFDNHNAQIENQPKKQSM
jgi:hypothetical protein